MKVGDRVRALVTVTEDGMGVGDPSLKSFSTAADGAYIHALPGEEGEVVHTQECTWPTVRFDRTGTATCVRWESDDPGTPPVVQEGQVLPAEVELLEG